MSPSVTDAKVFSQSHITYQPVCLLPQLCLWQQVRQQLQNARGQLRQCAPNLEDTKLHSKQIFQRFRCKFKLSTLLRFEWSYLISFLQDLKDQKAKIALKKMSFDPTKEPFPE